MLGRRWVAAVVAWCRSKRTRITNRRGLTRQRHAEADAEWPGQDRVKLRHRSVSIKGRFGGDAGPRCVLGGKEGVEGVALPAYRRCGEPRERLRSNAGARSCEVVEEIARCRKRVLCSVNWLSL